MAMHGTALGGGLEVAMAGHFRVAVPDAQMGQPEVNLGIIPGAEGTQRLPRLVGTAAAVEMCVSGKPIKAPEALRLGLIDRMIEGDLLSGALAFAQEAARAGCPYGRLASATKSSDADPKIFEAGRELARKTRRNMIAPLAAVDAIEAAATLPFEEGCKREREIMRERLASDECRALIHAFFAERAVSKIADIPKDTPVLPIRKAAIIGAGTMGAGIAMACANAGIAVVLKDVDQAALDRGMATIRKNYESSVAKGRFTREVADQRIASIQPQTGYDRLRRRGPDHRSGLREHGAEEAASSPRSTASPKPDCILATNTSTLDIDEIARVTSRPEMVIGLHFFSPANVMRLVEIVRGAETGKARDRDRAGAGQEARQGRRRGGELPRIRGQSHDAALYARGAVPGRRRRDTGAGRRRAVRFRHGHGHLRRRRYGRHRRGLEGSAGVQASGQARRARAAGAGQALSDGSPGPEDRSGLVSLRAATASPFPIRRWTR